MVDNYIKEVLFEHGKVYVPNLGLIFKNTSSHNQGDLYTLSKPAYSLNIDEEYVNEEDTWLAYAVARGERIGLDDAFALIGRKVYDIKSLLRDGSEANIKGVGTIINDAGKLTFSNSIYSSSTDTIDDNFGIPLQLNLNPEDKEETPFVAREEQVKEPSYSQTVEEPRLRETKDASVYNEDTSQFYEEDEGDSKTRYFLIGAGVILFLLLGWLGYYFFEKSESEDENFVVTEEAPKKDVPDSANTSTAWFEEKSDPSPGIPAVVPLAVKEKGKRYYIIAGAFTINKNAQKLKRRLSTQGVKAKVLNPKDDNPLYRVSLADFEEFNAALAKTEVLRKAHGNSIWILKY